MSLAWTTLAIIVLLLPGVFFFIGLSAHEHYSRELVRSTVVSDVASAFLFALILHSCLWFLAHLTLGFDLAYALEPFAEPEARPYELLVGQLVPNLKWLVGYVIISALVGLGVGFLSARLVVWGPLRFLATHKWAYEILKSERGHADKAITAFVMTTTIENARVLMYKGRLQEFYLNGDGEFSYVVMRNCSRYYMKLDGETPTTGTQLPLFDEQKPVGTWNYLFIMGDNIANILLDPTPAVDASGPKARQLREAVKRHEKARRDALKRNAQRET